MTVSSDQAQAAALQDLLDERAIRDCLTRLARGMDRHDTELARSAFHPDARDDHGLFIGSGHDFVDWCNAAHEAYASHKHHLTNMTIEIDGDEAHVETYVIYAGTLKGGVDSHIGGGRYVDRLERRDGRWGLVDRALICEWWQPSAGYDQILALSLPSETDTSDPSYVRPFRVTRSDFTVTATGAAFGAGE